MDYIANYYNNAFTHSYIFGVNENGKVKIYFITPTLDGFRLLFNEKPTTAKRQTVVKFRSTKVKREYLQQYATQVVDLCTIEALKNARRVRLKKDGTTYTENCGECLEWLIAERYGVKQNDKSNLSYTDGADLVIDGIGYQVKYEKSGIVVRV